MILSENIIYPCDVYNNIRDLFHEKESYVNKYVIIIYVLCISTCIIKNTVTLCFLCIRKRTNNLKSQIFIESLIYHM